MKSLEEIKNRVSRLWGRGRTLLFSLYIGITKKEKNVDAQPMPGVKYIEPRFHSSFKTWLRVVAFIVVAVFLPEQFAQAMEYDWRVLWRQPNASLTPMQPPVIKDPHQLDVPIAVKDILKDISSKPIDVIKLSPELTLKLDKPLKLSSRRIEEIYNWLIGKPCGAKSLYDFLNYQGVKAQEQDIAVLALSIDIINGVVKPEGNPEIIKNSLFALAKVSEFFGSKLSPVKITNSDFNEIAPFIAHLKGDHYVLVARAADDKVYFVDNHKEEFLPKDNFIQKFSGYALIDAQKAGAIGIELVEDKEAMSIKGAYDDYNDNIYSNQMPDYYRAQTNTSTNASSYPSTQYIANSLGVSSLNEQTGYLNVPVPGTSISIPVMQTRYSAGSADIAPVTSLTNYGNGSFQFYHNPNSAEIFPLNSNAYATAAYNNSYQDIRGSFGIAPVAIDIRNNNVNAWNWVPLDTDYRRFITQNLPTASMVYNLPGQGNGGGQGPSIDPNLFRGGISMATQGISQQIGDMSYSIGGKLVWGQHVKNLVPEGDFTLNINGPHTSWQNVGQSWDSTPMAPNIGIRTYDTLANNPDNGLLIKNYNRNDSVAWVDKSANIAHSWNPHEYVGAQNSWRGRIGESTMAEIGDYNTLFAPHIFQGDSIERSLDYNLAKGSPLDSDARFGSSPTYKITGADFLSTMNIANTGKNLIYSNHAAYGNGGIWELSSLDINGKLVSTQNTMNGFAWSQPIAKIGNLDMTRAAFGHQQFDRNTLDQFSKVGIPFKNINGITEHVINLNGARIQNGSVIGAGFNDGQFATRGAAMIKDDIDIKDIRSFDGGRGSLTTSIKGAAFMETLYLGRGNFSEGGMVGKYNQEIKGISQDELKSWVHDRLDLDIKASMKTGLDLRKVDLDLNKFDLDLDFDKDGSGKIGNNVRLFTPKDATTFSYSHHLVPTPAGTGSSAANLGHGVDLDWISSIGHGESINVHHGRAGISINNLLERDNNPATLSFSPTYSHGAIWRQTPKIDIVTQNFKVRLGNPTIGYEEATRQIKYADWQTGIHLMPASHENKTFDTWIGGETFDKNVSGGYGGSLEFGQNGAFYGKGTIIKDYASLGKIKIEQLDNDAALKTLTTLDQLNVVKHFNTEINGVGIKGVDLGKYKEDKLAANTPTPVVDWDLSYAHGNYTQNFTNRGLDNKYNIVKDGIHKDEIIHKGEIIDIGAARYKDRIDPVPTLVAQGNFFIPEILNKPNAAAGVGSEVDWTSTAPLLNGKQLIDGSRIHKTRYLDGEIKSFDTQVVSAEGINSFILKPVEIDTKQGKQNTFFDKSDNFVTSGMDVNSLALTYKGSKWGNIHQSTKNAKDQITDADLGTFADGTISLPISTTITPEGNVIRSSSLLDANSTSKILEIGAVGSEARINQYYLGKEQERIVYAGMNLTPEERLKLDEKTMRESIEKDFKDKTISALERESLLKTIETEGWNSLRDTAIKYTVKSQVDYKIRNNFSTDSKEEFIIPNQDVLFGKYINNEHKMFYEMGKVSNVIVSLSGPDTEAAPSAPRGLARYYNEDEKLPDNFKFTRDGSSGFSALTMQKVGFTKDANGMEQRIGITGWAGAPMMAQGLINVNVERAGDKGDKSDKSALAKSEKNSPIRLGSEHTYTIGGVEGLAMMPTKDSATLIQMGLDGKNNFMFNPVTVAGNLKYDNVQEARVAKIEGPLGDGNKVKVENKEYTVRKTEKGTLDLMDSENKIAFYDVASMPGNQIRISGLRHANADGSQAFAIPWSLGVNFDKDGNALGADLNYIGGGNNKNF